MKEKFDSIALLYLVTFLVCSISSVEIVDNIFFVFLNLSLLIYFFVNYILVRRKWKKLKKFEITRH